MGSTTWISLKIILVNKFILLVIMDHEKMLICFPFDRGNMDCHLCPYDPLCLKAIVICVKTSIRVFTDLHIGFDWRYILGIVRNEIQAIPPTFGKETVMIMYVVDATSL